MKDKSDEIQNTKEISPVKQKKQKKQKKVKLVKAKKIPKLFKKKYSPKKLEKLLKKIYIPSDKELIEKIFLPDEKKPELLSVNKSGTIEKKQLIRLKKIARDIKKRRAGFKLVPFAAVVGFIAAVVLAVITFKDILVKKAVVSAMQGIFNAKTDVDYLHLEILNTHLKIKNLQQANPDEEMKNIFQVGEINVDFNLTELLKGKVDIEDVTIAEVLINTDRTKSGKLIKKEKSEKEKKEKQTNPKIQNAKNDLIAKTQNTLDEMFADYNPQKIIENMQTNLKSPEVAQKAQTITEEMIEKWKNEPEKFAEDVKSVQKLYDEITTFDYQRLDDPVKIKELITLVTTGINTGNSIVEKTKSEVAEVQSDAIMVKAFTKEILDAVESDKKLVDTEIAKFTTLKDKGLKNVFNDLITAFVYGFAEQYSPYASVALDKVQELRANSGNSEKEKKTSRTKEIKANKKKRIAQRAAGRYVYYRNDNVPKFLLENAYGSGANWMISAKEFSSDADKRNKQSLLSARLDIFGTENKLDAVIDARTNTQSAFVDAKYNGANIPMNIVFDSYGMESVSEILCSFDIDRNINVNGSGVLNLSSVQILTPSFEPKIIYDIYKESIDSIKNIKIDLGYNYSQDDGLSLTMNTNAAENFQAMFTSAFNKAISTIADEARSRVTKLLAEKTNIATDKIEQFMDIEGLITDTDATLKKMQSEFEKIQKELTEKLKQQAEAELKKQAEEQLKNIPIDIPTTNPLETIKGDSENTNSSKTADDIVNGMKGLFGR